MKTLLTIGIIYLFIFACQSNYNSSTISSDSMKVDTAMRKNEVSSVKGSLNISDLKENNGYKDSDISIKFSRFQFSKTYIHDRYDGQYRYNSAERGDIFITSSISISAKSKDPTIPILCAYVFTGNKLEQRGLFDYNFSAWQDYGKFLGNEPDWNNDFAHTEKIRFDIGLEVDKSNIKDLPIYILAMNDPCVVREYDRFKEPTVRYSDGNCITGGDITTKEELKKFTLIKIINPQPNKNNKSQK